MIGYLLGLILAAWMPSLNWPYLLTIFSLVLLIRLGRYGRQLLLLVLAFNYALLWGEYQLHHRLSVDVGKVDLVFTGRVDSIVRANQRSQRFELSLDEPVEGFEHLRRVRLSLYATEPILQQGDSLKITARVQTPQRYLNDASPDAKRRALQRKIDATGYVRSIDEHHSRVGVRQRLLDALNSRFSDQTASTLAALLLGESWSLGNEHWNLLRITGTIHLVVVSGLHLGVLTLAGVLVGRGLLLLLIPLSPVVAKQLYFLPTLTALILASSYLWIGGGGVALQRAWVLVFVLLTGRLWRRTFDLRSRLNLALIGVTLMDPLSVLDLGFWLSFGLVWLLLQQGRWRTFSHRWRAAIRVQLVLSLVLLPVLVVAVGQLNLLSMVSNLWAIPWISFGVMALPLLLPLALLSESVVSLIELWTELFWEGLRWFTYIGMSVDWTPAPIWLLPLAIAGVVLLLTPLRLRFVGLVLISPLLLFTTENREGFTVRLLDVGQGQAAIIDLPNQRWVYDTGPAFGSDFSAAQLTLIPTLKREPNRRLHGLIISHSDGDHAGGVEALRRLYKPVRTLSGQPQFNGGEACSAQQVIHDSGVELAVTALANPQSDNDSSCLLLLSYLGCSLLIAGDITLKAERQLMRQLKPRPITWLQLSHHGSRTSSSEAWLDFWQPDTVLISRGRNNHFGHPHPEVMQRLERRNVPRLDTAQDGEIVLHATAQGCSTSTFLQRQQRYWY